MSIFQANPSGSALVTGGAGFIGSTLVGRLLQEGWNVTVIDNFDSFYDRAIKERNIKHFRDAELFTFVEADICDAIDLGNMLSGDFDVIVHLAAKAGVRPSIEDPVGYQEVNVKGTQNMLEMARMWGVKQFVFGSSSSVYGVNPNVPWSEEDQVLRPISPYASTKISGELLGHVYSILHDIRFIALRFFTVYGPRQRPDLAIHKFARRMLDGKQIPVYGDGSTRRDYTYVEDIVSGIIAAMTYTQSNFEVINLGNSETVSLAELIHTLEEVLQIRAIKHQMPEQPGDVPQTWANIRRAKELLGYEPATSLRGGLLEFRHWLDSDRVASRLSKRVPVLKHSSKVTG